MNMLYKKQHSAVLFGLLLLSLKGIAQTTTISYNDIPVYGPGNCFLNTTPGPTNPKLIGGYNHYAIVGGVDYPGNAFYLPTDNIGGGTAFGIYYPFSVQYDYNIAVKAKASSPSIKILWSANKYRTGISISCSPGFTGIITGSANATSSITGLSSTYADYQLVNYYSPSYSGVNYLLFGDYNTANSIGAVQIESVSINQICKPPTITSVTSLGGGQVRVSFQHPAANSGVGSYKLFLTKYYTAFPGMIVPVYVYQFPGISIASNVFTANVPPGVYSAYFVSNCNSGLTSKTSNSISVTVN